MSRVCEISGKKTAFGGSHTHRRGKSGGGGIWSKKAPNTKRKWYPNLRTVKVQDSQTGQTKRIKISMKIYKKMRNVQEGK